MIRGLRPALAVGLVTALACASPSGFRIEEQLGLGTLFAWRDALDPPRSVAIVGVESKSLQRLRQAWDQGPDPATALARCVDRRGLSRTDLDAALPVELPSRRVYACIVDELHRRGVPVVAFDVVFREGTADPSDTAALANAIAEHGRVALVASATRDAASGETELDAIHPLLASAAAAVAGFTLPESSGRFGHFLAGRSSGARFEQLPVAALRLKSTLADGHEARNALDRIERSDGVHLFNYYGPPGSVPTVTVADLLLARDAPQLGFGADLAGRVVWIGQVRDAGGRTSDSYATRYGAVTPMRLSGVELAATAFDNLLEDAALRALPEGVRLGIAACLGAILTLTMLGGPLLRALIVTGMISAVHVAAAYAWFRWQALWLPFVTPLAIAVPSALLAGLAIRYRIAQRWLRRWGPDRVVTRLLSEGSAAAAPHAAEVTVMFVDVIGFVSIAEQLGPDRLRRLLAEHVARVVPAIQAEHGSVADLIGDCVMAYWGDGDARCDHALRACRAALAIAEILDAARRKSASPVLRVRIGIATGPVSIGDEGGRGRGAFRLVGNTVHLAQRLEQLCKTIDDGASSALILVAGSTEAIAGPHLRLEPQGDQRIPGRQQTEAVFRLLPASDAHASARDTRRAG